MLMQLRKVCNHPDLFEPRAIESGFLSERLTFNLPTLCILHYYNKMKALYTFDRYNLLYSEDKVGSHYIHDTQIKYMPHESQLRQLQEENSNEVTIYRDHFSFKWRNIKANVKNENLQRAFDVNSRKISLSRPMYGFQTIEYINKICDVHQREEIIREYGFIKPTADVLLDLRDVINNYMISYDRVITNPVVFRPSHYSVEFEEVQENINTNLTGQLQEVADKFHYVRVRSQLLFPDKKFLIYDCGKLNTMMQLLIKLKADKHKVLIFTQMTKMLDLFEFSLNVFHMTYVRLDGGTRVTFCPRLIVNF